jgi:formylglycine-generating enzyme required for sulfatase activity
MEADFTKADRLEDAQSVRSYRTKIASGSVAAISATATAPPKVLKNGSEVLNSIGMRFVEVKGTDVLFCVHETRRQDYELYASENQDVDSAWKNQRCEGIPCGANDDHPVTGVNWHDAKNFCDWLSRKEGKVYRLPTDEEWSFAVGIGRDEKRGKGITPSMVAGKQAKDFPWGTNFPPRTADKSGNYSDINAHGKFPLRPWIEGYDDGFITTSPVMSFKPSKSGIYDLGGNVNEWCEDWYDHSQQARVLRGASWNDGDKVYLLSDHRRHHHGPTLRNFDCGFRCVIEVK